MYRGDTSNANRYREQSDRRDTTNADRCRAESDRVYRVDTSYADRYRGQSDKRDTYNADRYNAHDDTAQRGDMYNADRYTDRRVDFYADGYRAQSDSVYRGNTSDADRHKVQSDIVYRGDTPYADSLREQTDPVYRGNPIDMDRYRECERHEKQLKEQIQCGNTVKHQMRDNGRQFENVYSGDIRERGETASWRENIGQVENRTVRFKQENQEQRYDRNDRSYVNSPGQDRYNEVDYMDAYAHQRSLDRERREVQLKREQLILEKEELLRKKEMELDRKETWLRFQAEIQRQIQTENQNDQELRNREKTAEEKYLLLKRRDQELKNVEQTLVHDRQKLTESMKQESPRLIDKKGCTVDGINFEDGIGNDSSTRRKETKEIGIETDVPEKSPFFPKFPLEMIQYRKMSVASRHGNLKFLVLSEKVLHIPTK